MAGTRAMMYGFFFKQRKTAIVHRVTVASTWLLQAKYRQMKSKPDGSANEKINKPAASRKMGSATNNRLGMGFWSTCIKSATIRRAERKAVSPLVTAALITPKMQMVAMTGVNHSLAITPTMALPPRG